MFNVFKKCLDPKSTLTPEDLNKFNSYIFCRWLSGSYETLRYAQFINTNYHLPDDIQFKFVQKALNGRKKYIPFPKK